MLSGIFSADGWNRKSSVCLKRNQNYNWPSLSSAVAWSHLLELEKVYRFWLARLFQIDRTSVYNKEMV
jgi:hypothetical protein